MPGLGHFAEISADQPAFFTFPIANPHNKIPLFKMTYPMMAVHFPAGMQFA
jgi:hypothetical protein